MKSFNGVKIVPFTEQTQHNLTKKLNEVAQVTNLSWEFTDEALIVTGLDEEPVMFSHWRSASAYLDAYLVGYNHGFGDGRRESQHD